MVNYEKLTELFQLESFKEKASECKTMEDFHKLFNDNGVEISEDETIELISQIAEKKERMDNGEILEEDLENVAGGLAGAAAVAFCVGVGVVGIGAFALSAYVAYQGLRWANKHTHK